MSIGAVVRAIRYGENGYFGANDTSGSNIILSENDTEGTNRIDVLDVEGFPFIKEIIKAGQQEDGGYVDFVFAKAGEMEPSQKRGYAKFYDPFGWVALDVSAITEEQIASINSMVKAIDEVSKASDEGAKGTVDIVERISEVTEKTRKVLYIINNVGNISEQMKEDVAYFTITE